MLLFFTDIPEIVILNKNMTKPKKGEVNYELEIVAYSNPLDSLEFKCTYEEWKFGTSNDNGKVKLKKLSEIPNLKKIYKITFPVVKQDNSMICYAENSVGKSQQIDIKIETGKNWH